MIKTRNKTQKKDVDYSPIEQLRNVVKVGFDVLSSWVENVVESIKYVIKMVIRCVRSAF